jgi:hypothetical protein
MFRYSKFAIMPTFEVGVRKLIARRGEEVMRRVLLALFAGAVLSLSIGGSGCDDGSFSPGPESGGSKGPEMGSSAATGHPASGTASSMPVSTPTTLSIFPALPCDEGLFCTGTGGCMSPCDAADAVVTTCARCDNGAFAGCTDTACQP